MILSPTKLFPSAFDHSFGCKPVLFCCFFCLSVYPAEIHNRKCNGYNGNCVGFNGNYNGVYWYVVDYIGGMLNPIGKMPKTHNKKVLLGKANGS